jgi:hypothetical protein
MQMNFAKTFLGLALVLSSFLIVISTNATATAQVPCTGPKTGVPGLSEKVNPPVASAPINIQLSKTFSVARAGVYVISGTAGVGKGAGGLADFTWVKAVFDGKILIDERPPPITGNAPNGWTYHWSIYYWTVDKPFEIRTYLEANRSYTYSLTATGHNRVVTQWHRRNYGASMSATATLCGPAAGSIEVGVGCVGASAPTLMAPMLPVLGERRDLVMQGRVSAVGFVAFGLPVTTPVYIGAGCNIYLDLRLPYLLLPVRTNASGTAYALFTVPPDPALAGLRIGTQGVLDNPLSPIALDWTNGVVLTLGY